MFDNLDGSRFYQPATSNRQSKLAVALFAKELARRLQGRGIAVKRLIAGAAKGTQLERHCGGVSDLSVARLLERARSARGDASAARGQPAGDRHQRELWANCRITEGPALLGDGGSRRRLWEVSNESSIRTACRELAGAA